MTGGGTPAVSIVIVNWNGRKFLPENLGSIYRQTFDGFEVIVVDNGSTDGSVEFIKERYPAARLIINTENKGFAAANNQGMEAARGLYVATINNDTVLDKDFLLELVMAAETSTADTGMWAPKILSLEERDVIDSVGGLLLYPDGLAKGRGRLERDRGQYDSPKEIFIPSACASLYRKSMLDSIGGFDASFFAYCEDTDLGLRARLAGWKAVNVPKARIYHHYSGTGGRYTSFKAYLVERNRFWVAVKNFPAPMLLRSFFYVKWRYIVQTYGIITGKGAGGRFVEGAGRTELLKVLLRAYRDALKGLPTMIKKRRAVQSLRKAESGEIKKWLREFGLKAGELVLKD